MVPHRIKDITHNEDAQDWALVPNKFKEYRPAGRKMEIKRLRASLLCPEGATAQTSTHPFQRRNKKQVYLSQDIVEGLLTFDSMAREHSACRKSAKNGGDLGWFDYPGDMEYEIYIHRSQQRRNVDKITKTEYDILLLRTG